MFKGITTRQERHLFRWFGFADLNVGKRRAHWQEQSAWYISPQSHQNHFRANNNRFIFYIKAVSDRVNTVNKLEPGICWNSSRLVKVDNIKIRWQFDPKRFWWSRQILQTRYGLLSLKIIGNLRFSWNILDKRLSSVSPLNSLLNFSRWYVFLLETCQPEIGRKYGLALFLQVQKIVQIIV